jgi:hypothetical protein
MIRFGRQHGFVLLPVVLAITLIAVIAFMLNNQSAINVDVTAGVTDAVKAENVARAGLAHATWGAQNSGCAGDMGMTTVPFGLAATDNYTATVTTPGGATTAYPNLTADQDAWFRSDIITSNSGGSSSLHLKRESGNLEYAVARFDLSTLPAGSQINSAVARFYIDGGNGHPEGPVTVHRATADWTETGATWETMGDKFDSAVLDTIPAQPAAGDVWVQVNLTAQVQAWVNGGQPNYGVMLIPTGEGTHAMYISREGAASEQPGLDVIVGTGPATPATITATGTLTGNPSPANDITRALTRTAVPAYQPNSIMPLQPGPEGKDAMIHQWKADWNYGANTSLYVRDWGSDSDYYSLLQFNLGRIPHGAKVYSAQLALYQNTTSTAGGSVGVQRITRDWDEGAGNGGTAPGVTWNERDTGLAWTAPGGDFASEDYASTTIPVGTRDWFTWDITGLVSGWVSGTFPNQGLAIVPESTNAHAQFVSSDATDPALRPRLTVTYACECGSPCLAPQGSGTVLMVVVNPTTLVPADAEKKALFESWGYTVNVISESANQSTFDAQAALNDVIYVSSTVNANNLGSKLAILPIGVVSEDGDYNPDLGFAAGAAWTVDSAVNVTDTSHYITAPFAAGQLDVYTAGMEQLTVSGTEGPGLQTLADTGGAGSLVVLDSGAMGSGGSPVAGRRVMLPLGRANNFNWDYLNGNGRLLVQRALQWGTGNTGGPPKNLLLVVVDPGNLTAQEAAKQALIESWGYTVNLIDESDSQANFDAAIAANGVAYVSSTVSATTLGTKLAAAPVGVVNELVTLVGEFGIGQESYNYKSRIEIDIIDNTHYITQPFATGLLTIFTANQNLHLLTSNKAPDFNALAQVFNTGTLWDDSLGTIETGGALYGGGTAAGRRVLLPWGDAALDVNALNADGQTLMQRAIEWAEGATGAPPQTVLFVVPDAAAPGPQDTVKKTLMESWGFNVSLITAADSQANFDAAVASADVAYVSEEITSSDLGTKLRDTTIGVINEETALTDEFGIAGVRTGYTGTDIDVVNTAHYITSVFASGPLTIASGSTALNRLTGSIAPELDALAETTGNPELGAIETGGLLYDGGMAAGRRVQLPWGADAFDINLLNTDGQTLMRRAIEWGAGAGGGGAPSYAVLLVVGDAVTLSSKDAGYKALMESWGHTVTLIDDGDSQANFDAAAAANDVIYVSGSSSGPSLLDKLTNTTTGLVNEVNGKIDNFGFSSSTSATANFDTFSKTDAAHYITEPFSGNPVTVFTASLTNPVPGGTLAPDLQNVGEVTGTLAVGTLDAGATRHDGNPSPERRAHLPFTVAETTDMTADGKTILQRTLEWAAGAGTGGGGGGGSPPAGPVFEEFTEAAVSNATSVVINKPAGTGTGDLLIAAVAGDGSIASTLTPPAGWNLAHVSNQDGQITFGVWWKLAGASESSTYSFTWSGARHAYGWIMRFTGHDPATPINAVTNTSGSGSAPQSPSVTSTVDDTLILRLGGFDDDDITAGAPGLTGHTAINMADTGNGPSTVSGGAGYVLQPTAGASGTSSFALTASEEYVTVTIAIAPAP